MAISTGKRSLPCAVIVAGMMGMYSSQASANWTLNVGYQNPAVSTWGLNLLYLGSRWGFEAGVGWVDAKANVDDDDKDGDKGEASIEVAGDIDLKYFFSTGTGRPFLQGGFGVGVGAKSGEGAGASTGSGFVGLGVLFGKPSFYGYGSFNLRSSDDSFVQAGLGIDI